LEQSGQRRGIVKALLEDIEVFHNLALQSPLVAELGSDLPRIVLNARDPEIVFESDSPREALIEEEVEGWLSAVIERGRTERGPKEQFDAHRRHEVPRSLLPEVDLEVEGQG